MADTLLIIEVHVYRGRYSISTDGGTGLSQPHEMPPQLLNEKPDVIYVRLENGKAMVGKKIIYFSKISNNRKYSPVIYRKLTEHLAKGKQS